MTNQNKFNVRECRGILQREQLDAVLQQAPLEFYTVDRDVDPDMALEAQERGEIDVYHKAAVVYFFPPQGKRLSSARVTDLDFPLRPDNVMDELLGLRSCFHPRLSDFGISPPKNRSDEIELDIYKFPKKEGGYVGGQR